MEDRKKKFIFNIFKIPSVFLLKLVYWPKQYGKENIPKDGNIIFAGNHKHAFDPALVVSYTKRHVRFFAKEEVSGGLHGFIMRKFGTFIVYKDRKKNIISIKDAELVLENGGAIGIFPEGTRNRTDKDLLPFKAGTTTIAKRTNTKILPFAIRGKYRPFRRGLEIEYGKPIDISNMESEEANEFLKEEVLKLLKK